MVGQPAAENAAPYLEEFARTKGIKYFMITFLDLFGVARSKLVPAAAIGQMCTNGAGFAGFATHMDLTPAHPDVLAFPDASSVMQAPWKPQLAWVAADLFMDGEPIAQVPRTVLKQQVAEAAKHGFVLKTGVECEFFLLAEDGKSIADVRDTSDKPCYDQGAIMRRYDIITEVCDYMQQLGWKPYQSDHEDANGQFEMNWEYDDAVVTADRHAFFKFMVKSVAEKHSFRATFMPKPFAQLTGNGCHVHASLWSPDGAQNLFADKNDEKGLSKLAYSFIAGLLSCAEALAAITNPTVNSYKRTNGPVTHSGATWAPNTISYTGNNRTHMIRIPDASRLELRLADGAVNPYLLQAALLAAGLHGVKTGADPGPRMDNNMYEYHAHTAEEVRRLPANLLDALRALHSCQALREGLGSSFIDSYIKLKIQQWDDFMGHLTQWERDTTLDC